MSKKKAKALQRLQRERDFFKGAYESASTGRRVQTWKSAGEDANKSLTPALSTLRNRSRDLYENSPYARKIIHSMTTHCVGIGILGATPDPQLQALYDQWSQSVDCDIEQIKTFAAIQQQVANTVFLSGDCFVLPTMTKRPFPLALRVLEGDYCPHDYTDAKRNIYNGIRFAPTGERVSYYFYKTHPGSEGATKDMIEVPADKVCHVFQQSRPGANRGVPLLSSVLIALKKYGEFNGARLERTLLANLYVGAIESAEDDPNTSYDLPSFEPGTFVKVSPGSSITFSQPPSSGDDDSFESSQLRSIAAGTDSMFELVSGDLSNVNYSSMKLGATTFMAGVESWQENVFIPLLLSKVWKWFVDSAVLVGAYRMPTDLVYPPVSWTTPQKIIVDLQKEATVKIQMIQAGIISLSSFIRELGYNPSQMFEEIKQERELLKSMGLSFTTIAQEDSQDSQEDTKPTKETQDGKKKKTTSK